jgi:uncharacterized protein (TIGR02118 family)
MPKIRLSVAYNQPDDPDAFFAHYRDTHVPLARAIPGLEKFEWSKVVGTPTGDTPRYALIAELTFASMETFSSGLGSPEGQAASADVPTFAPNGADIFTCELAEP